jgi:hypothetical protein
VQLDKPQVRCRLFWISFEKVTTGFSKLLDHKYDLPAPFDGSSQYVADEELDVATNKDCDLDRSLTILSSETGSAINISTWAQW